MHFPIVIFLTIAFSLTTFGQSISKQYSLLANTSGYETEVNRNYRFMDKYRIEGPLKFKDKSMVAFYGDKRVKQICIKNEKNEVIQNLILDTTGQIVESRRIKNGDYLNGREYYSKTVQLPNNNKLEINQIKRNGKILKSDSVFYYTRSYVNGDTNIYHSYSVHIIHIQGRIINERNEFYNSHYLNVPVENSSLYGYASTNLVGYTITNYKGKKITYKPEVVNYLDTAFKTDYNPDKVYLVEHSIRRQSSYTIGLEEELPVDKIYEHPYFQDLPLSDNRMYFVEGENFNQPVKQSLLNGYSDYGCYHAYPKDYYPARPQIDNGYILRESDGLIESSYCDYYEFDDSPEAQLLIAHQDSIEAARIEEYKRNQPDSLAFYSVYPTIVTSPHGNQKRRIQKFKERKTAYCYEYEFYDDSSFP